MACFDETTVVVYQAFRPDIATEAVKLGRFGPGFSLTRMSWIKPGFLWIMHRSGWATKPDQQRVVAVRLRRTDFDRVVDAAVPSSYDETRFTTIHEWRSAVANSSGRVQWDPDHGPHGESLDRRVIQLGLRGQLLRDYAMEMPAEIVDVTDIAHAGRSMVTAGHLDLLETPVERLYSRRG
jgi:hypothetical protein